jgi:hypothetical protein
LAFITAQLISFSFAVEGGDVSFKFISRIGRGSQGSRGSARSRQLGRSDRHWLVVDCYSDHYTDPTGETSGLETQQTISQMGKNMYLGESLVKLFLIKEEKTSKNKTKNYQTPVEVLIVISIYNFFLFFLIFFACVFFEEKGANYSS